MMLQVGCVPVTGDAFETGGYRFEVVDMDGKRVDKVLVTKLPPPRALHIKSQWMQQSPPRERGARANLTVR